MPASEVATIIKDITQTASEVLPIVEALDPAAAVPGEVVMEVAGLAAKALAAWSAASGTPITVESVRALLPNATPLSPPTQPAAPLS